MPNATPPFRPNLRGASEAPSRPRSYMPDEAANGNGSSHDSALASRILRLREELGTSTEAAHASTASAVASADEDLAVVVHELRIENDRLKGLLEQARQRLDKSERGHEQSQAREQEYERLLEEKSEVIRQLHIELLQAGGKRPDGPNVPNEEELIALHQELEREREQLKQDEQALMTQVRDMEIQLSRERADMARQRNELQRFQNELKHQLEVASRDASVRERLAPLYKLQDDLQRRRPPGK